MNVELVKLNMSILYSIMGRNVNHAYANASFQNLSACVRLMPLAGKDGILLIE